MYANTTGENKNIFTLPSSRQTPGVDCRETGTCQLHRNHEREACPLHRKPLTQVTASGTQERVCESCLDPSFIVLALPEATDHLNAGEETVQTDEQNLVHQNRYATSSSALWWCAVCCLILPFIILIFTLIFGVGLRD